MTFPEFVALHTPALEADEARFTVPLAIMAAAAEDFPPGLRYWTLGGPGCCAIQSPGRAVQLGALNAAGSQHLAREIHETPYPGVGAACDTARWFVEEAATLGAAFAEAMPLRIHVLREPPRHPGAEGAPRNATEADAQLLFEWMTEFHREAIPHDPAPQLEKIAKGIADGRDLLWTIGGEPVSVAAVARAAENRLTSSVFTPQDRRSRGFAGEATAALCERIFAEGKAAACLYTDLRNSYSNRCYAKIGFKPHCDVWHYIKVVVMPAALVQAVAAKRPLNRPGPASQSTKTFAPRLHPDVS